MSVVPNARHVCAAMTKGSMGLALSCALSMTSGLVAAGAMRGGGSAARRTAVPYPEGYRSWVHVKSALVTSRHSTFEQSGGFRHIYANAKAVAGYSAGTFDDGSIIVVDWLVGTDQDGEFTEGARRRVDVMVKGR